MSYVRTYRGEFSNTLPGPNNIAAGQDVVVYDEGSEWTTAPATGVNYTSTEKPLTGSVSIKGERNILPINVAFQNGSLLNINKIIAIDFYVFLETVLSATSLAEVAIYNGATLIRSVHNISVYGLSRSNITSWQHISIPLSAFTVNDPGLQYDTLKINVIGVQAKTVFIDSISIKISGQIVRIDINDTSEDADVTEIVPLEMAGDPLQIATINDEDDKLLTIRSKHATIKVLTGDGIEINTFCEGTDRQFYVEIFVDELIIFRGFLIISQLQVDFMPDPNQLILTATDNLPALKDIDLVNDDGDNPQFDNRLIDYIRWALLQTGIKQNINIVNSLKHGLAEFSANATFVAADKKIIFPDEVYPNFYKGMKMTISGSVSNDGDYTVIAIAKISVTTLVFVQESITDESIIEVTVSDPNNDLPFHQAIYLDAKTFEKEISVSEDSYTVLNKILGEDSMICQHQGEWWIVRIDEIEEIAGVFQYKLNSFNINDGSLISSTTIVKGKSIGKPDTIQIMNDDPVLIPDRAVKRITLTYKYQNPLELLCNIDFTRGDFIEDLPDVIIKNDSYNAQSFEIECWINTAAPFTPGQTTPPPAFDAYIKRLFQNGYEKARYVVMPVNTGGTDFLESQPIKIAERDRFNISVDFAWDANQGGSGAINLTIYFVTLQGKDGTNWYLDADGVWHSTGSPGSWTTLNGIVYSWDVGEFDETGFRSVAVNAQAAPVSGLIRVALNSIGQSSIPDRDMYYNNIQFTYIPFINGSYQKYTGQSNKVSQDTGYTSVREKDVFISDGISVLHKGAMKIFNGQEFVLSYGFTDAHWANMTPYGKIQAYAVWNQYRKNARNFDIDADQLESDSIMESKYDGIDLIHKINMTDVNENTNSWHFMLLHYNQDFYLLEMKGYLASLYRKDIGKVYTDPFEFKYLTS